MKQKSAIVLGGTTPHIALIQNLQQRGYYTILVDYYDNPPAKIAADEHVKESTLDQDKVLELARKENVDLVISACVDQANLTACYVAEQLGLPAPYSYKTALNVTNKGLMKKIMIENNIPTSRYYYVDNYVEIKTLKLEFPVVVKPADSNSSAGVKKAENMVELNSFLKAAIDISRTNKAIIEEFKDGLEISVDCYIKNKKAYIIMDRQKFKLQSNVDSVLQSPGSMAPAEISQADRAYIQSIVDRIAYSFNLCNTSLLVQALVNGDEINIIEFAPRVSGGLPYRTVKLNTGFDILDATVNSYLGKPVNLNFREPKDYYLTNILHAYPGIFNNILGVKELIEQNIIEEFYYYKTKGMKISSDISAHSRVGAFLVKGSDKKELLRKTEKAIKTLEVYDINNNPILRKDIFCREVL